MKTRRNLIKASLPMVGTTCWSSEAAPQRGPTFKFKWRNLIQIGLLCAGLLQTFTSEAQTVTKVATGSQNNHSLFLKSDGSLWGMGDNLFGDLGTHFYPIKNQPNLVLASNVTAVAVGYGYSQFVMSNGVRLAVGWNNRGQLGDGTTFLRNSLMTIEASNVTMVAAGYFHTLYLKRGGSLWASGDDSAGELGDGYTLSSYVTQPMQIVASNVTAIAAGYAHSLFLKNDGSLWGMGYNLSGQLGDGTYYATDQPEQIMASNVTATAAGSMFSWFLKSDGSLWAMGRNAEGQLGDGTYILTNRPERIVASNVMAIAAGSQHSVFLKSDGSLWTMGRNAEGQLGDGTYNNTNRPEQVVAGGVTAIGAGQYHTLFVKSDGSLWGMGFNAYGQLGDGTTNNISRPEQILGPYNQIQTTGQLMGGTNMQLSFVGVANANYALDRATSLSPPDWIPQATNPAGPGGALVFTNPPDATTNNFWRIRSVP
jgi:alpha-tubulin suppressor-like RCC1 family protein